MTLQMIESHDVIKVESVVIHVFSDPGIGKTTLANTGNGVLLIDFDDGAHRSLGRQRVVRLDKWGDLEGLLKHPWLEEAGTLAIDTTGRALDLLSDEIIADDPKLGSELGGLNQRGWGALKQRFARFFHTVRERGKDVLLLSHAKLDKDRDGNKTATPDIPGGSAGEVFKVSDAMAYYSMVKGRRVLDFNTTEYHVGKNPAAWGQVEVPDHAKAPHFMAEKILKPLKDHLNSLSAEQAAVLKGVADWQAAIEGLGAEPDEFTKAVTRIGAEKHDGVRAQAKTLLWRRAKGLGFDFDKTKSAFVKAAPEAPREVAEAKTA